MHITFLQNHVESGPGLLQEYCKEQGWTTSCIIEGKGASWVDQKADVYVFLGSLHSVNEGNRAIVSNQKRIVKELVASDRPVFGICFGAQLIADAIGGSVSPLEQRCDGWHQITEFVSDEWMGPWFKWHEEWIAPPETVEILARDKEIVQVFKFQKLLGVQFHPEVSASALRQWRLHEYFQNSPQKQLIEDFILYADLHEKQIRRNAYRLFDSVFRHLVRNMSVAVPALPITRTNTNEF